MERRSTNFILYPVVTIHFITDTIGELQYALDGLQQFMKKHHQNVPNAFYPHIFDREFLYKLVKCFNYLDPKLLASVNAQWKGFKTFARSDGVQGKGGKWTRCHENGTQWVIL